MAQFALAFAETSAHEAGWVHDPHDAGGETYRGIARNYWPSWGGWAVIDKEKTDNPTAWKGRIEKGGALFFVLDPMVQSFYRTHFWDTINGDSIPDQRIANELFDTGVNMHPNKAVEFLQRSLNLLNRDQALYADLMVDGRMGPRTITVIELLLKKDPPTYLFELLNLFQGMHYIRQAEERRSQEKFLRGWLNRVTTEYGAS